MAVQTASPQQAHSAQVVGNAFVEQYYPILHQSPELVYKFYQDKSVLSRPGPNGLTMRVTTMESINDTICSLDFKNYEAEIKSVDAQYSFNGGVIVLVTGCLTGKDNLRRKFTQMFFLAPQDTGYYVLNDVFRYVEESEPDVTMVTGVYAGMVTGVDETPSSSLNQDPETVHDSPKANHETSKVEEVKIVEEQVTDESSNDGDIVAEAKSDLNGNHESLIEESVTSSSHEDAPKKSYELVVEELVDPAFQGDAPKKSYASIVSSQAKKGPTKVPIKVYVPANTKKVASGKTEKQTVNTVAQASGSEPSTLHDNAQESKDAENEVVGHSIYIRNLPLNATVSQLEAEFKKFGTIKLNGIQVRSNKQQGFCFGFVEFDEFSSMQNAVKASPVTIGDRQAVIEIKRTTTRVGSGRGSRGGFFRGRGGRKNDSFRSRVAGFRNTST